ncbi:branched-chain amino acid ABC transporter permease [Aeromicrobium camelliae]|uniref:Branched-chain amino acid ABC transporter permease n=1 Tax=Aeromicrobium camelliae TaxID=1538144 RepID=A0A3N6WM66_9ACTN|nr:branched-chain amino acid ABC transporter permease [Aeromicrobium camelliae]RQN08529.1 branched-chain amino acid ABC transporter permease [Aeromicrobium camelliae]
MDWGSIFSNAMASALGPDAIVYALAAIGLNVHFGYTGLLNFGQAGFMAVAAYGLAASVATWGLPFWVGIAIGFGAALLLALLLGVPTLRLRADYLAIATIASAEILRLVFGSVTLSDWFGGSNGRQQFANTFYDMNPYSSRLDFGLFSFSANDAWVFTVGWFLVALSCLAVWSLMRSPWGRVLKSIREDEDAVRSLGKNVFSYKMQALILGGMFGALAGFMLAIKQQSVIPTDYATDITFFAYTALLLGGAGRVLGPVIGAIIFWFLMTFLGGFFSSAASIDLIPDVVMSDIQASLVRFILVGAGLMALMIFRPQGIFGDRREIAIDGR